MSIVLLTAENLSKSYGERHLFEQVSFRLMEGQKTAIVAHNGVGKSTLLNILVGDILPDEGQVVTREGIKIAYLRQDHQWNDKQLVKEYLYHADNSYVQVINHYKACLAAYEQRLDKASEEAWHQASLQMDNMHAWDYETRMQDILQQLQIVNLDQPIGELSGGQRKKLALASVLIDEADIMLLDEPTNHLDINTIEWLESLLSQSRTTLLLVTHDRYFLDAVCDNIIEIDGQSSYTYEGNYSYFLQKKAEREAAAALEISKAKNLYRKELDWMRRQPKARTTKSKARIDAFYDLEKVAKKRMEEKKLAFDIKMSRQGRKILEIHDMSKSWDDFKVVEHFDYVFKRGERIGLIGKNGSGKTSFLQLLSGLEPPDKGSVIHGETTRIAYYTQEGLKAKDHLSVIDIVKEVAEVVDMGSHTIGAAQFLFHFGFSYAMQQSPYGLLSGGERRKLYLLLTLMQNPNFLILDEPTNDLDIFTLSKLEEFLESFKGCLIIVSHDRFFLDKLTDHLFVFEGGGKIKDFVGNYTDYRDWQSVQTHQQKQAKKATKPKQTTPLPKDNNKATYKEKKEFEQLEKDIEALTARKQELLSQMEDTTLEISQMQKAGMAFQEVSNELDEKELRWLELSEKKM